MVEDFGLSARAVEKNKTSIKSRLNPFLQPPENDLSPQAQPQWFLPSLPLPPVGSDAPARWAAEWVAQQ